MILNTKSNMLLIVLSLSCLLVFDYLNCSFLPTTHLWSWGKLILNIISISFSQIPIDYEAFIISAEFTFYVTLTYAIIYVYLTWVYYFTYTAAFFYIVKLVTSNIKYLFMVYLIYLVFINFLVITVHCSEANVLLSMPPLPENRGSCPVKLEYFPGELPDKSNTMRNWYKLNRILQLKWYAAIEKFPYDETKAKFLTVPNVIEIPFVPNHFSHPYYTKVVMAGLPELHYHESRTWVWSTYSKLSQENRFVPTIYPGMGPTGALAKNLPVNDPTERLTVNSVRWMNITKRWGFNPNNGTFLSLIDLDVSKVDN